MKLGPIFRSMRPPFLVLTPICVFLGMSITLADNPGAIEWRITVLVIVGALFSHISVNMLNEYMDFKSGLDMKTSRTPFSGGSGALPEDPGMAVIVLSVATFSIFVTMLIGISFIIERGLGILPIGLIGLLIIVFYTQSINKYPLICLVAPGAGFGLAMVAGTQYVFTGGLSTSSLLVALIPFFLVNNLLLLNQYPDVHADASVGRNHFPIAFGIKNSNKVYGLFALMTILTIVFAVMAGYFPVLSLIALLPMPLSLYSLRGALRYHEKIGAHIRYMATNVAVTLLVPLLLSVSIIYGHYYLPSSYIA